MNTKQTSENIFMCTDEAVQLLSVLAIFLNIHTAYITLKP